LGQRRGGVAGDQPAKAGSHASADGKRLRSIQQQAQAAAVGRRLSLLARSAIDVIDAINP